ncbi:hypothetical protein CON65_11290 [Bacillus pseudomycoides]|uniref:Uncharacterized protein n=1 Tax=Bacillus pseudomycoides TaxID=64104 RepID=A0AA91VCQ0_9BACI|nr:MULTISPECIES: DUF6609 family protein [Bacillus]PEB47546.1 hypothetical protein COO03_25810 [Bacillus sp. AFS098217]PED82536.1 hypothetical protein CON65_11290 [Bacillus pseudomycoides]PEU11537.1 hypothetical protein CN525_22050 [Bacillus sp. AFS014408]PEU17270.1 hypothetical protein CN524_02695 [Bacillus sp. AFS019443]PFW60733.1 hypothetical protein COL20_20810 [Bacillus sp. AFS075034]
METQAYKYPRQKINGIWLIISGIATFLLLIKHNGYPDIRPFIIVYALGMIWQLNPRTRKKLAVGSGTKGQKKWSNFSMILLTILVVPIFNFFSDDYRICWLLILLAVGIHFLTFIPVHGKLMLFLAISLTINAIIGLYITNVSLDVFFVIDGLIKILFGGIFIRLSPVNF